MSSPPIQMQEKRSLPPTDIEKSNVLAISVASLSGKGEIKNAKGDENDADSTQITSWKAVVTASVVTFIAAIENTVVGMSEWPYMSQIDKEADAQYFGNATAASKFCHAFSALFFAVWCHRKQSFKAPLVTGRIIAFFACLLYLCVEFFDNGRRHVMAVCYVLFGVAASSSTILRAYVAAISHPNDRPQAYSGLQAATMVSIIVGPVIQAAFSSIKYPGYSILHKIKFHIFSAPVWVAAATNFVSVAIIMCRLEELPRRAKNTMKKNESWMSLDGLRSRFDKVRGLNLNWRIVALCWIQKMNATLSIVTLTTLTSIIFMTNYGWERERTVLAMSITMGMVGLLAVGISCLYFFAKLGHFLSQRLAFLIGLCIFMSMYLFAYPWQPISHPTAPYNATEDLGCNPLVYSWCDSSYSPQPIVLLVIIAAVMGIGIPLSMIALDAIYSKCLGDINQSVMQGAMIVAEDVILIFGPIYSSGVYTIFGFATLWTWNGIIVALGTLLWIWHLRKLQPYS